MIASSSPRLPQGSRPLRRDQHGIVLFIALIVMVALSLAGVALVRSVDTTTSVTGNLAFRQAALLQANWAIENAIGDVYALDSANPGSVLSDTDKQTDHPDRCYYATFDTTKESTKTGQPAVPSGVPEVLWKLNNAKLLPTYCRPAAGDSGNRVAYVVQRMCTTAADGLAPNEAMCELMEPKQSLGTTVGDEALSVGKFPLYRVTVRVDGPNNSLAFVQAMIRG